MDDAINNLTPDSTDTPQADETPAVNDQTPISNDQPNPNDQNSSVDEVPAETPAENPVSEPAPEDNSEQAPAPVTNDQTPITNDQVSPNVQNPNPELVKPDGSFLKNLLAKAGEKIQFNKNKKLEKVMQLARQKALRRGSGPAGISNKDVCEALRVSQATATNYFNELEKQGKLKQVGRAGHDVFYEPA